MQVRVALTMWGSFGQYNMHSRLYPLVQVKVATATMVPEGDRQHGFVAYLKSNHGYVR